MMLVESPLTRPNNKSAAVPKFAEQRVITAINNRESMLHVNSLELI